MRSSIENTFSYAAMLHQAGKFNEAEIVYQELLAAQPEHYEALFNLGLLYNQTNLTEKSISIFQQLVLFHPHVSLAHYNLAVALRQAKHIDEATKVLETAIMMQLGSADIFGLRGLIAYEAGRFDEALEFYERALQISPQDAEILNSVSLTLDRLQRYEEALLILRELESKYPQEKIILYNKSLVLFNLKKYEEAVIEIEKYIKLDPSNIKVLNSKAAILLNLGRKKEVIETCKEIIYLPFDDPEKNTARCEILYNFLELCEWHELDLYVQQVIQAIPNPTLQEYDSMMPLVGHMLPGVTLKQQYDLSERFAYQISEESNNLKNKLGFSFSGRRYAKSKMRIGYISSDFRAHPLSQLIPEVFELHNRDKFTVYAYSYGPNDNSLARQRIVSGVDFFVDMESQNSETIARRIFQDEIDILIDLTGFSWVSPTKALALRPAPIQVSYLGYLGTMAAEFIDALIADKFVIPPELQRFYKEQIYYLPCYQANDRRCVIGKKISRYDVGLPEQGFVFCCFNHAHKITPVMFDLWCQLLLAVPDSVLWLFVVDPIARQNLCMNAQKLGVDPRRLIFAEALPLDQHLARMQCADLFLDTHPYNAGTTASNALWAGLPLITYVGETFPSRMAGSLLQALDMPELITYSLNDYYELALSLATNRERLQAIKNKMSANKNTTILFDTPFFTTRLEQVYVQMWDDYINKELG